MGACPRIFFPSDRRSAYGLTLVELLAAMAILGGVLVGLMTARHWHMQQWTKARQKQLAVQAADRLLTNWQCSSRVPTERSNPSSSFVSSSPASSSPSLAPSAPVNSPLANALSSMPNTSSALPTAVRPGTASPTPEASASPLNADSAGRFSTAKQPADVSDDRLIGWPIPCPAQGSIDELGEGWSWMTQSVANPQLQALGAEVIRLEIFPPHTNTDSAALVAVEIVVPASVSKEPPP